MSFGFDSGPRLSYRNYIHHAAAIQPAFSSQFTHAISNPFKMPRQSRGPTSAPRRPTAAPPTRAAAPLPQQPPQARQASTVARPAQSQQPPTQAGTQQSAGPGMFGTMASTAAYVPPHPVTMTTLHLTSLPAAPSSAPLSATSSAAGSVAAPPPQRKQPPTPPNLSRRTSTAKRP
jgi:hypothetical protein